VARKPRAIQVGIGGIGKGHFKRLMSGEHFRLVAVVDRYPEREDVAASRAAAEAAGIPFFTDYRQALRKVKAEAAFVCTPHPWHAPISIAAMQRGMGVFTEKPAASSAADAQRMLRVSQETGMPLSVGFNPTAEAEYWALKNHIAQGDLGEIREVVVVVNWYREDDYYTRSEWVGKEKMEGKWCRDGVMFNQSSHFFAAALWLASRKPGAAFATATRARAGLYRVHPVPQLEMEDLACAILELDGQPGKRLIYYGTTCNPSGKSATWVAVFGERGQAVVGSGKIELYDGKTIPLRIPKIQSKHENLRRAITRGETPLCPIAEGVKVTEAVELVYKAARNRIKVVDRGKLANLSEIIYRAAAERRLFSEMSGAPDWAAEGKAIAETEGYALPA